jgi:preprotein translocase subunit SecA
MAGRGVDIMLGGNSEHRTRVELRKLGVEPGDESWDETWEDVFPRVQEQVAADHERVKELGGLFILGTERHESRRIDNQLRGRSGRQGDPGESRFYLSAEDDLVRLFAGDRIYRILDRLGPVDDEGREQAIEAKMLSRTIENAQKKVEQQNFLIRKRVLEYDDVMNQQREVVYRYRREILEGRDMSEPAKDELRGVFERIVGQYTPGDFIEDWDVDGMFAQVQQIYDPSFDTADIDAEDLDRDELTERLHEDALEAYDRRESELGGELMRELERGVLLQIIDERWREHLYDMDYLREGIHLRGFAQRDPLVEYKNEGFALFRDLMNSIWEDFGRYIFHVQVQIEPAQAAALSRRSSTSRVSGVS